MFKPSILIVALLSFETPFAFADGFNLNLEGKIFTCTEGGTTSDCVCKRDPDRIDTIAVYFDDIKVIGNWEATKSGVQSCKSWIKNNPDVCN